MLTADRLNGSPVTQIPEPVIRFTAGDRYSEEYHPEELREVLIFNDRKEEVLGHYIEHLLKAEYHPLSRRLDVHFDGPIKNVVKRFSLTRSYHATLKCFGYDLDLP